MKVLVVYDSNYGNTEKIAQAIGRALGGGAVKVGAVKPDDLKGLDVLIMGSPTHGGFPTEGINTLLKASLALEGVKVAAFDTRAKASIFGYAAPRIARGLEKSGGSLVVSPEGFIVLGIKGPLKDGELERAASWAKGLAG